MHKLPMTVGFADLSHFVRATEVLGDEKAIEMLQSAFKAAGNCIIKHGGKIRKYIGDTILFTFDEVKAACLAAHEIRDSFSFNQEKLHVRFNIGLATGQVWEVMIGHPDCKVEDVYGKTVNTAALLSREAYKARMGIAMCPFTIEKNKHSENK